jgi:hypothetical protein
MYIYTDTYIHIIFMPKKFSKYKKSTVKKSKKSTFKKGKKSTVKKSKKPEGLTIDVVNPEEVLNIDDLNPNEVDLTKINPDLLNIDELNKEVVKPSELKSVGHKNQGKYGTCGSHALSRSICRTFQVLTIIDGDTIERFYTLIYVMILKLFNIGCNDGINSNDIPSIIKGILEKFYDYSTNPNSELNNYKYSDIECEYNINDGNEVCNLDPTPILKDLKDTPQELQFKSKFKILYDITAFKFNATLYNFSMDEPNYPNYIITDLLEKKLQPYIGFSTNNFGHAVVLQSWGIKYNKYRKKEDSTLTVFCYKNTWNNEYKMCYDDIKLFCDKININKIVFICLDYKLEIIKKENEDLYNEIMKRRHLFFDTVYNIYKEEGMKNLNNGSYKGELKNGNPEGQGRMEYINGDIYEGEFKDGNQEGKGIIKYYEGYIYRGEFKNGKPEGEGFIQYKNGDIYRGKFIDGTLNGQGKIIYKNGARYQGEFKNGKQEGIGIMIYENRDVYHGNFINGLLKGKGIMKYKNGNLYKGDFNDGKFEGKGIMTYENGDVYEGEFKNGFCIGKGKIIYKTGDIDTYEGGFIDGYPDGKGIMKYKNGDVYEGEFDSGSIAEGKIIYENGDLYEGIFDSESMVEGKMTYKNGDVYEGEFEHEKPDGKGKMKYKNGDIYEEYEGKWKNGKPHGKGTMKYKNNYIFKGIWRNGEVSTNDKDYRNDDEEDHYDEDDNNNNYNGGNKRKTNKRKTNKRKMNKRKTKKIYKNNYCFR